MKHTLKTVFGLALIAAGVIGILVFSGVINLSFSIVGWWTLFIIIPCIGSLFTGKEIRHIENSFGVTCLDLRGAIIDSDIDIKVEVAFGGIALR